MSMPSSAARGPAPSPAGAKGVLGAIGAFLLAASLIALVLVLAIRFRRAQGIGAIALMLEGVGGALLGSALIAARRDTGGFAVLAAVFGFLVALFGLMGGAAIGGRAGGDTAQFFQAAGFVAPFALLIVLGLWGLVSAGPWGTSARLTIGLPALLGGLLGAVTWGAAFAGYTRRLLRSDSVRVALVLATALGVVALVACGVVLLRRLRQA